LLVLAGRGSSRLEVQVVDATRESPGSDDDRSPASSPGWSACRHIWIPQGGPDMPTDDEIGFERDIKPLFRVKDRDAMLAAFDLFEYDDVAERADDIVESLRSGQMPCDGAWPAAQVDKLQQWIDTGKPA
jgi:hypothetical protein